jgi:hypothetical protein
MKRRDQLQGKSIDVNAGRRTIQSFFDSASAMASARFIADQLLRRARLKK